MTDRQDLEGVWTVLASDIPIAGISVTPVGYTVSAGPVMAGIDSEGRRHLLIPLLPGEAAATNTKGRAVQIARIAHEGVHYLTVLCLLPELHSVFTQFCRELADSVEAAGSPAREAVESYARWRDLFSDAIPGAALSDGSLIGLIGELLTVEALLQRGASPGLTYWLGPSGEIHDVRTATHAIEVKATLVREGRIVPISSIDQLLEPPGAKLHLHHLRLERDPNGTDLEQVIARVVKAGADRTALGRLLQPLGVSISALEPYRTRKYRVADTRLYDVNGPAFPRLVRSSFQTGSLPPGILRVSYAIDLTNEPPHPATSTEVDALFDAVAREAL